MIHLPDRVQDQAACQIPPKTGSPRRRRRPRYLSRCGSEVKESADRADGIRASGGRLGHTVGKNLPERAQDNAKYYAGKTAGDAAQTAEDRKEVEKLVEDAENTLAKLSEENTDAAHNIETLGDKISTANGLNIKLEKQTQIAKEEVTSLETAVQADKMKQK